MAETNAITIDKQVKKGVGLKKATSPSPVLVSNVILANLANKRQVSANTKTKGEVSGGGKKPWRQKGTGRARAGSNRSPLWSGGGITFGPRKNRNFSKRINRKQKVIVLNHLLNMKSEAGNLVKIDKVELTAPKTNELLKFIADQGVDGTSLLVLDDIFSNSENAEKVYLAGRNISFLNIIPRKKLSAYFVSKYKWIIITKKAMEELNEKANFGGKKEDREIKK